MVYLPLSQLLTGAQLKIGHQCVWSAKDALLKPCSWLSHQIPPLAGGDGDCAFECFCGFATQHLLTDLHQAGNGRQHPQSGKFCKEQWPAGQERAQGGCAGEMGHGRSPVMIIFQRTQSQGRGQAGAHSDLWVIHLPPSDPRAGGCKLSITSFILVFVLWDTCRTQEGRTVKLW